MSLLVAAVSLILATVAVHVSGLYILTRRLQEIGARDVSRRRPFFLWVVLLTTLCIVALHMLEVWIWAMFYRAAVAGLDDWPTAAYFSLGAYSTVGTGQVILPREWRMLEGLEAIAGALMFGLSTALMFGVINEIVRRWGDSAFAPRH